jgi:hypothetical protein
MENENNHRPAPDDPFWDRARAFGLSIGPIRKAPQANPIRTSFHSAHLKGMPRKRISCATFSARRVKILTPRLTMTSCTGPVLPGEAPKAQKGDPGYRATSSPLGISPGTRQNRRHVPGCSAGLERLRVSLVRHGEEQGARRRTRRRMHNPVLHDHRQTLGPHKHRRIVERVSIDQQDVSKSPSA